ncbi:DUF3493 domain-containing protein [Aetokthonos hydrillicola Thurmond2011]|jgi:hypothetical protein|uniref:DUF3493 domain-containing protein n=1 Tax=Aetokthonos hydrillicola Thurmond2011 TaxID=2712845 RepID=A0AAP5I4C9_9CYAN|nr:DUF3493 domain-containing protein [Aetokthonos hydrillicola]MBO3462136.1 DUF3493 domain-containing protein [Aetokthonos hydrillicola CCALA 1050]MBW4587861.1 DUF3493 domain-containing protein [Aetokthonos hydrillicola CCALA 1050]MDR9894509.1 DUF3493 domain-containing protein [Aetokthonos hydrillicola Thurmond2011]
MAQNNSKNPIKPEQYARLRSEAAAPYRGIRKFIYAACGASGLIGTITFFSQLLARRDWNNALPNLALQIGVVALMVFLWRLEKE